MVTCCVAVNCVACSEPGSGTTPSDELDAKCVEGSKAGSAPPSRERETWILVSLVVRDIDAVRWGSILSFVFPGWVLSRPLGELDEDEDEDD